MALWEVVGGKSQGGILVRKGKPLKSAEHPDGRLSVGAKVKELEVEGDRLHYELQEGTGPKTGWVSLTLKDQDLVRPIEGPDGPERKVPPFKHVAHPTFDFLEMRDRAGMTKPGDYYGIEFPHTKELLDEWGVKWLTKAFLLTGAMSADNEVVQMETTDVTKSVSGGSGLKYRLDVKYKRERPYLHKDLFVKVPHLPKGSDRYYVSVMWGHDRPEHICNIWLHPYIPFKVPKTYFCDINEYTTNFVLITERVLFSPPGTKEFKPGDIEPAALKYSDFQMSDGGPMYYFAALKNLGKMAAYHKTGRLAPNVDEMYPMPPAVGDIPVGLPGLDGETKKMDASKLDTFIKFMNVTATTAFPKEITDIKFLEEFKAQMLHLSDYQSEMGIYCCGSGTENPLDYVALTHNNCQVDNCIYWHNDQNEIEVGMLDWGVLACGPLVGAVMGGCISGAQVHIFKEYLERFVKCFLDSYEEHGGPKLDFDRFMLMTYLGVAQWVMNIPKNVAAVVKDVKSVEWATVTDIWNDERVQKKWNAKAWASQFNNGLCLYQQLDIWATFTKWKSDMGIAAEK